jgi:mannose-6-phosphate isomerase
VSLVDLIAERPEEVLGAPVLAEFGARLPFLLKVLAAAQPLSLQAHPDAGYAREAYAAERAAGSATGPVTYTDPYHKPEMLVALTPFDALCGFRDPAVSADLLARLGVAALDPVAATLRGPVPAVALRDAVVALLTWPVDERPGLVAAAVAGAGDDPDLRLVPQTAARYPADPGVVVALLLNRVLLEPGQAIWMPAGNLHAYLEGTGIELLANSDNVLRGGFTPKPVNVPELLRVLRFEVLADPVLPAEAVAPGLTTWPVPVRDFRLFRAEPGEGAVAVPVAGPAIALCVAGSVTVDDGTGAVVLASGSAALAPPGGKPVLVSGAGTAFVATTGG